MFPDGICLSACIVDVGSVMDAEAQAQWAAWVGRSEGPAVRSSNQGARPCLLGLCSAAVVWGEVPAPQPLSACTAWAGGGVEAPA